MKRNIYILFIIWVIAFLFCKVALSQSLTEKCLFELLADNSEPVPLVFNPSLPNQTTEAGQWLAKIYYAENFLPDPNPSLPTQKTEAGQWLALIWQAVNAACNSCDGLDTAYRTTGKDSIQFTNKRGQYYAILDSIGTGGGGGGGFIKSDGSINYDNGVSQYFPDTITGHYSFVSPNGFFTRDTVNNSLVNVSSLGAIILNNVNKTIYIQSISGTVNCYDDLTNNSTQITPYELRIDSSGIHTLVEKWDSDSACFRIYSPTGDTVVIGSQCLKISADGAITIPYLANGMVICGNGKLSSSGLPITDVFGGTAIFENTVSGVATVSVDTGVIHTSDYNDGRYVLNTAFFPTVVADDNFTAQTTSGNFIVYPSTSLSTYRVGCYITITAISVNVITCKVVYQDETSTTRTLTFFPQGLTSAGLSTTGAFTFPTMNIRSKSGTNIILQTTITGIGSQTYDYGGTIEKID